MVLTTALLQDAIHTALLRARPGDAEVISAWSKLLWLFLDMMASAYHDTATRESGKALA
jgi:hypothetical protein